MGILVLKEAEPISISRREIGYPWHPRTIFPARSAAGIARHQESRG